jgi:hypothetical protein
VGLKYEGKAPDLGAYEYGYVSPVIVPVDTTPKDTAVTPIVVPVDTSVAPVDSTEDSTEVSAGDSTTLVRPLPQRRQNMQQPGHLFYVNGRSVNALRAGDRKASRIRTYSK